MANCILRVNKIKTMAQMQYSYEHNARENYADNAEKALQYLNDELLRDSIGASYSELFRNKIKESNFYKTHPVRKNATLGIEVVAAIPHDMLGKINIEQWKKDNEAWLEQYFNGNHLASGSNVVSIKYHGDENGGGHIHALVIPMDEKGQLSASRWLKGREKLIEMQTEYANKVGAKHGLKRGLKNSVAKHQAIKNFYAEHKEQVSDVLDKLSHKEQESLEEYEERVIHTLEHVLNQHLQEKKELERDIVNAKTNSLQSEIEKGELEKQNEQLQRDLEFFLKNGMNTLKKKAAVWDQLDYYLKNHPDRYQAKNLSKKLNECIQYTKDHIEKTLD